MKNVGLITFVIVICVIGVSSTLSNMVSVAMNGSGGFSVEGAEKDGSYYVWERDLSEPLEGIDWTKLDTINGHINVISHEDASIDTAEIHAVIKIKPSWLSGKDNVLEAKKYYDVSVERDDHKLVVRGVHPKSKPRGISNASIQFDVKLPARMNADVHTVNGKIDVSSIQGKVIVSTVNGGIETEKCPQLDQAQSTNGSIKLRDLTSLQKAKTVNGSIDVRFNESPSLPMNVNTVNGSVKFHLPNDAKYDMKVNTVNGGINYDSSRFNGTHKKREVYGKMNGGGPELNVSTVNGSVSFQDA
jgi:hypothetical protein